MKNKSNYKLKCCKKNCFYCEEVQQNVRVHIKYEKFCPSRNKPTKLVHEIWT